LADLVTPGMILGLAFGRIGCLMNGCCYGEVCNLPCSITFPAGSFAYFDQMQHDQLFVYGIMLGSDMDSPPKIKKMAANSTAERTGLKVGDNLKKIDDVEIFTTKDAYTYVLDGVQRNKALKIETTGGMKAVLPTSEIPSRSLSVHPTQIYSAIDALLLCFLLLTLEPYLRREGELFAILMGIYAITRFFIEILRTDEPPIFGTGMTIAQNISVMLLLLSIGLLFYIKNPFQNRRNDCPRP